MGLPPLGRDQKKEKRLFQKGEKEDFLKKKRKKTKNKLLRQQLLSIHDYVCCILVAFIPANNNLSTRSDFYLLTFWHKTTPGIIRARKTFEEIRTKVVVLRVVRKERNL
jgi:hypothetical protein